MLNRARSSVTSSWPCLRTCFKIWTTWGFWSRISCLQRKDYQREHEVKRKKKVGGRGKKGGKKRQLAIAVESSSGEHFISQTAQVCTQMNSTSHFCLFSIYIKLCAQKKSVAKFQTILTIYELCQRQCSKIKQRNLLPSE